MTGVDREFGRLLDELEKLGLEDNTIVVFTSDHGETMCSHSTYDPKNSIYTESYCVPFMIRYPDKIRHRVDSTMLSTPDIMPTLLGLAGLEDRIPESVEGNDLSPVFLEDGRGCQLPDATLYIRNLDGDKDENGIVHGIFPEARGVRTDRYTMEIAIDRDSRLKRVLIFDDWKDPYQMDCIPYTENRDLFSDLCAVLDRKLEESNDIWYREGILDKVLESAAGSFPDKGERQE